MTERFSAGGGDPTAELGITSSSIVDDRRSIVDDAESWLPWWQLLVLGAASAAFGLAVLVWPHVTLRGVVVVTGLWLVVAGGTRIVAALLPGGGGVGGRVLSAALGVILLVSGLACLRNVVTGLAVLAWLVSLAWLFGGLTEIAVAVSGRTQGWLLAMGVLSTIVGIVFLVWPALSLASVVLLLGLSALVVGGGQILIALRLRAARNQRTA